MGYVKYHSSVAEKMMANMTSVFQLVANLFIKPLGISSEVYFRRKNVVILILRHSDICLL